MAKVKNKKNSGLADKVRNKRRAESTKKVLNPFEVHVNREKFKVLGRKSKHDRGLPGVSRAKAIQKRKETIGTEMKLLNKTNSFVDRRIGEKDSRLTGEEKILARFAAEQAKQHTKNNIYNLTDDVLTHRGQTLEDVEKFDDPRSSDEDDDDGRKFGGLNDKFVAEGHFGGGTLSRTETRDGAKSHKDLIEQLIAESKKRKAEKQKLKEQTLDLTEKLDTDWKDLQPIVFKKPRLEEKQEESVIDRLLSKETKRAEDYDKMMRELKFEKRGTPTNALQSDEKLAKQEKERLEKLEAEREERMRGAVHSNITTAASKHRSADDLDDNFDLDDGPNYMVSYDKDGKLLMPEEVAKEHSLKKKKVVFENELSDSNDEEDKESETEEELGEEGNQSGEDESLAVQASSVAEGNIDNVDVALEQQLPSNKTANVREIDADGSSESEDCSYEEEEGSEEESEEREVELDTDIYKVPEENEDSDDEIEIKPKKARKETRIERAKETQEKTKVNEIETCEDLGENDFNLVKASCDELINVLSEKIPEAQSVFLERLTKRYHPSLAEQNKDLLSTLFAYLLQYVNDIFSNLNKEQDIINSFRIFSKIAPQMYDLAQLNVMNAKHCLTEVVVEKYHDYKKKPRKMPDLDTLIFFKLVSLIFPTSDFRHPVVTPCFVFMSEILTKCKFNSTYSIARGLFVTALILEYTILSKRFVPSAINFIRGLIFLSAKVSVLNPIQLVPPFKLHSKEARMLVLDEKCSKMANHCKMAAGDLVKDDITDEFKVRCLSTSVAMLKEMFTNCIEMETQQCMFEPHIQLLSRVDLELYPSKVIENVNETVTYMKEILEMKTYAPLAREKKRPKALKLYEPDVQDVFTGSKSSKLPRELVERNKLKHKLKRETKGALREIRKDKAFIASVNIKQKIMSDNIRKNKVKQIYKDASLQQGELNKLKRNK